MIKSLQFLNNVPNYRLKFSSQTLLMFSPQTTLKFLSQTKVFVTKLKFSSQTKIWVPNESFGPKLPGKLYLRDQH